MDKKGIQAVSRRKRIAEKEKKIQERQSWKEKQRKGKPVLYSPPAEWIIVIQCGVCFGHIQCTFGCRMQDAMLPVFIICDKMLLG